VHVGATRLKLIARDPLIQDAVITGHERSEVGALVFLNSAAVRARGLDDAGVREHLRTALKKLASETATAARRVRCALSSWRAALDRRERDHRQGLHQPAAVLERRAVLVEDLHADRPPRNHRRYPIRSPTMTRVKQPFLHRCLGAPSPRKTSRSHRRAQRQSSVYADFQGRGSVLARRWRSRTTAPRPRTQDRSGFRRHQNKPTWDRWSAQVVDQDGVDLIVDIPNSPSRSR